MSSNILRFPPLIAWALAAGLGLLAIWCAQLYFSERQRTAELQDQLRLSAVQIQLLKTQTEELSIINARLGQELKTKLPPPH